MNDGYFGKKTIDELYGLGVPQIHTAFGSLAWPKHAAKDELPNALVEATLAHVGVFVEEVGRAMSAKLEDAKDRCAFFHGVEDGLSDFIANMAEWEDPRDEIWACVCDCGNNLEASKYDLVTGSATSCGHCPT